MREEPPASEGGRRNQSVRTACAILRVLKRHKGARLTDVTEEVDLSKGTVHVYLRTLEECGFVVEESKEYRLSYKFITYGEHVRKNTTLYRISQPIIDDLAAETGEYAHLMVEERGQEVALYESQGTDAVATDYHLQMRAVPQFMHDNAAGKAILAHLPEERIESIIDQRGLPRQTPNTITRRGALFEELDSIRERGFAVNDEEGFVGIRAVSAPIIRQNGEVVGAVSVTGPKSRLQGSRFSEEIPKLVIEKANIIEIDLETSRF